MTLKLSVVVDSFFLSKTAMPLFFLSFPPSSPYSLSFSHLIFPPLARSAKLARHSKQPCMQRGELLCGHGPRLLISGTQAALGSRPGGIPTKKEVSVYMCVCVRPYVALASPILPRAVVGGLRGGCREQIGASRQPGRPCDFDAVCEAWAWA